VLADNNLKKMDLHENEKKDSPSLLYRNCMPLHVFSDVTIFYLIVQIKTEEKSNLFQLNTLYIGYEFSL